MPLAPETRTPPRPAPVSRSLPRCARWNRLYLGDVRERRFTRYPAFW